MIHLLPVLAKTVERVMLGRISDDVELYSTQFGSQRQKGVHGCIVLVYQFLMANKDFHRSVIPLMVKEVSTTLTSYSLATSR